MDAGSRLKIMLGAARRELNARVLNPAGFNLTNRQEINTPEVSSFLAWLFHEEPRVTCIQVGANDGQQADPLKWLRRDPAWHSWLLEPNPEVYHKLRHNTRREPHTTCLPLALGEAPGRLQLHTVDRRLAPASLNDFLDVSLLSSLDIDSLIRGLADFSKDEQVARSWIKSTEVAVVDWAHLLDQEVSDLPDLVVVDAEGYDFKLLRCFPFDRSQPTAFLFEHHWMTREELTELERYFESHGYQLLRFGMDTVAVQQRKWMDHYTGYPFNVPLPAP